MLLDNVEFDVIIISRHLYHAMTGFALIKKKYHGLIMYTMTAKICHKLSRVTPFLSFKINF